MQVDLRLVKGFTVHLVKRDYWINKLESAWKKRSVIWLAGVRRVGKTCLCQSLPKVEYFDCELPRVRHHLEDPEAFLSDMKDKCIILDEIHRLNNPTELLKIASDHYPSTKIIATGSSSLDASKKFRDTLAGRKYTVHLTPMLYNERTLFDGWDMQHRLLFGGLPPYFIQEELPEADFQEWLSAFWARDIQELFKLERRHSFIKFTELLLAQSGSIFEATRFTSSCEVSRTTISNYLSVLEATYVAYVIRPFSTHIPTEIISAPKVYGFDTGFVCHCRGWINLRKEDLGQLWEHIVLNELKGRLQDLKIGYWRNKQQHEIDFVVQKRGHSNPIAIECKWKSAKFDPQNLLAFRKHYPKGKSYVVSMDIDSDFQRDYQENTVSFVSLDSLIHALSNA